jgi:hypothetical protein
MSALLWLLALQGALGAFDTLYYHELRARLPARGRAARPELHLHALRDLIYALLFGTLPWLAWQGAFALALGALFVAEIAITLADFAIEDAVRRPQGGVYPGERVTHAVMGIVYGAALAQLAPIALGWWALPTALAPSAADAPQALRLALTLMAAGVLASGLRDLASAHELGGSAWPWRPQPADRP